MSRRARVSRAASDMACRVQQLLRMAYAHVQMFLYRPFLHYVSQNLQSNIINGRSYACAAACVSVSRNIIRCTSEMKRRGLLVGAYWFYMYTTFFAIISLVFFALENPQSSTSKEILRDVSEGRDALASLAKRSMAADKCTLTLAVCMQFDRKRRLELMLSKGTIPESSGETEDSRSQRSSSEKETGIIAQRCIASTINLQ